jgi:hypothetical protein
MASSLVMSLIGAAGLAAALLVGCGDNDAKPIPSKLGESCANTAQCADGLSCIANVCYSSAPTGSGGEAGQGTPTVVGPVLGGEGESCTSRRDCADTLACFNQRCTAATSTGEGGATGSAPAAQLGDRGETCRVNADCSTGLVCVPSDVNTGVGVCDVASFGIAPTGMYCGGECQTAADCCQLPLTVQTVLAVKSCEDITAAIAANAVDCAAVLTAGTLGARLCFADATYCSGCSATTWKCTNSACEYNVACIVAAGEDSPTGCPTYTRLGRVVPTCNPTGLKCTGPTVPKACTTDASCTDAVVADSDGLDTCSDGECTCYAGDHQCYRQCAGDLDCAPGKSCDKDSHVCVPSATCTTDQQCAVSFDSIDYKCNAAGNCAVSCTADRDCSPAARGIEGEGDFNGQVCGTDGFCISVLGDCSDSTQCSSGGLKSFCIPRPTVAPGTTVSSAVTD